MRKKKVMIIDNDPGILDSVKLLLEVCNYDVEATDDLSIVTDSRHELPDILLLDIWMSGVNGKDVCKQLKSRDLTRQLPIIMFSANREIAKIAQEAGADDYIAKPFELNDMLEKIERYT